MEDSIVQAVTIIATNNRANEFRPGINIKGEKIIQKNIKSFLSKSTSLDIYLYTKTATTVINITEIM